MRILKEKEACIHLKNRLIFQKVFIERAFDLSDQKNFPQPNVR